jgi:hypothetical protein
MNPSLRPRVLASLTPPRKGQVMALPAAKRSKEKAVGDETPLLVDGPWLSSLLPAQQWHARRGSMACRGAPGQRNRSENVALLSGRSINGAWPTASAFGVVMPASFTSNFYLLVTFSGIRSEKRGKRMSPSERSDQYGARSSSSPFPLALLSHLLTT